MTSSTSFTPNAIHPEPVPLYAKDDPEPRAYACGQCGYVFGGGNDPTPLVVLARQCCSGAKCKYCQVAVPRGMVHCGGCQQAHTEAEERDMILRAARITSAEWTGPVYNPAQGARGWYASVEKMLEDLDGEEMPTWVWGGEVVPLALNAEQILQNALEEASEDAIEEGGLATSGLQELLDSWCKKTGIEWWQDAGIIVVLKEEAPGPSEREPEK